ncbi:MAG: hypothetical protein KC418_06155 [Anaerolineales bacterium]|nr:hypothetical protein [Anaerolineales bacterium]
MIEETETVLKYEFASAWEPPVAWLEAVSSQFPTLRFVLSYEESGVGFTGVVEAQNGEVDDTRINIY